jgi:hypothetical protein
MNPVIAPAEAEQESESELETTIVRAKRGRPSKADIETKK